MNLIRFIQLDDNQNYENTPHKLLMKTDNHWLILYYTVFLLLMISFSLIYSTYLSYPTIRKGLKETLYCTNTNQELQKKTRSNRLYRIMTLIRILKDFEASSPTTPYASPIKQIFNENIKNNSKKLNSNEIKIHNNNNNNNYNSNSQQEVFTRHVEDNKEDELCDTLLIANQITLN